MKRFLIVFVSIITLLAFFSSASAIDRSPKEDQAKEKEKPAEFKELERKGVKEGKAEEITPLEKQREKTETQAKEEGKIKEAVPEKLNKRLKSLEKQKAEEKYDYFLDKNNNGIDDRLEQKSQKPVSPSAIRPVPQEKQPVSPAPSVKGTSEEKKIKEAPKEKEAKKTKGTEEKKRR